MKLLILLATSLLFYTQATEEKKCIKEYVLTDSEATFSDSQSACENFEGEMASEDLKDSENAAKAQAAINAFRENRSNKFKYVWLGITIGKENELLDATKNPFVFSDGTEFNDSNFVFRWRTGGVMDPDQPDYSDASNRCSTILNDGTGEKMTAYYCVASAHGLCKTYQECEDSANSESVRFRANSPVFALFTACSVFKTFHALFGILY